MLIVSESYNSINSLIQESKKSDKFEEDITKWLNDTYGKKYNLEFKHMGGSNSTVSDIFIKVKSADNTNGGYIECKMARAQAAHITLDEVREGDVVVGYKYSGSANENDKDDQDGLTAINVLVKYINERFKYISKSHPYLKLGEAYADMETDGEDEFEVNNKTVQENFDKAIIRHYRKKNVKFVASGKSGSEPKIFKLENFANNFNISATFRVLRSGSRDVSKIYVKDVMETLGTEGVQFFTGDRELTNLLPLSIESGQLFVDGNKLNNTRDLGKCLYIKTSKQLDDRIQIKGKQIWLVFQDPVQDYIKVRISSYKGEDSDRSKPSINFSVYLKDSATPDTSSFEEYLAKLSNEVNK